MTSLSENINHGVQRIEAEETKDLENADIYKVVLIGNSGVGKTSMLQYLLNGEFIENHYEATVSVEFGEYGMKFEDDEKAKLQIWDTAGQERYADMV